MRAWLSANRGTITRTTWTEARVFKMLFESRLPPVSELSLGENRADLWSRRREESDVFVTADGATHAASEKRVPLMEASDCLSGSVKQKGTASVKEGVVKSKKGNCCVRRQLSAPPGSVTGLSSKVC